MIISLYNFNLHFIYNRDVVCLFRRRKYILKFIIIKPTICTNFSNLFLNETLLVSDSSSVHHQESFTVNTAVVYVIQVCWQLASKIRMDSMRAGSGRNHPDPARMLSAKYYDIYHCCMYNERPLMMEKRTVRNM